MKKYILPLILFPILSIGQTYSNPYTPPIKVDVTVKKNPYDFSTSFNQAMQAGAAVRQAAAANRAAAAQQELVRLERERQEQDLLEKKRIQDLEKKKIEEEK